MYSPIRSSDNNWQEYPILMAVSCLSPVKTQILIPADRRLAIVRGTPSCNLSSIAVAPKKKGQNISLNHCTGKNVP